ncbi:hypothetical protein Ddye_022151 [Dipteronia dyeriana]|uniref:RNase H type-1 domain-containing protein n=1 Tax=Dipteronia dyeriana TaxID=168575 RepID=A0AAD9U3R2_9ROSI|nr:hypothetical protein Ddye_022151 [Dipteronia dyeriana]
MVHSIEQKKHGKFSNLGSRFIVRVTRDGLIEDGGIGQRMATRQEVIREYEGQVMGTSVQRLDAGYSPEIAEAVAILCGIVFAEESGLMPVVDESDTLGVVQMINLEDSFWLDSYPHCVEQLVLEDFPV